MFEHHSQTPGGATLQDHANNPNVTSDINQGNWDYVVLQEQSQLPSFPDSQVQNQVYPYALQLSNLIKTANPCGNVIFYMTQGRKMVMQPTVQDFPQSAHIREWTLKFITVTWKWR